MNSPKIDNFLRRTLLAAAAAAGLAAFTLPSVAQTSPKVKTDGGSSLCDTYTSLALQPDGTITVSGCQTGTSNPPTQPAGESFAITTYPTTSMGNGTAALVLVTRSNMTASDAAINYTITGGCSPASGTFWIGQVRMTEGFQVIAPPSGTGTCTVAISNPSVGAIGTPGSVTVSYGPTNTGGGTPQPQPPGGCPAIPADAVQKNLGFQGADQWLMPSGVVGYAPLTDAGSFGRNSGRIVSNDVTATPSFGMVREITISKCPGEINPKAGGANNLLMADGTGTCYWTMSGSGSAFNNDWFAAAGANPSADDMMSTSYHICEAYKSAGTWYLNVRYSYSPASCPWGQCGLTIQSNFSGFNP